MCLNMHLKRHSLCLRAFQPLQQIQQDRVDPIKENHHIKITFMSLIYWKKQSEVIQTWKPVAPEGPCSPFSPGPPCRQKGGSYYQKHHTEDSRHQKCVSLSEKGRKTQVSAAKLLLIRALTAGPIAPVAPLLPSGPGAPYTQEE